MSKVGSNKVLAARKRQAKEREFLSSLSVQCDDEDKIDLLHDDEGNLRQTGDLVKVVSGHSDVMRFTLDGSTVDLDAVNSALEVIASCGQTIRRFTKMWR